MSTKTISSVLYAIPLLVALLCGPILAQNGNCEFDDIGEDDWQYSKKLNVKDIDTGIIFEAAGRNVKSINKVTQSSELNSEDLYVKPVFDDSTSTFTLTLTDLFARYEELETSHNIVLRVEFTCASLTRPLTIYVSIIDTNNHYPEFLPTNTYDYKIFTPMPQGVPISTFYGVIQARDYDLTTKKIIFEIEENDYLEMIYDKVDDSKKIHTGILQTKAAILRLDQPLVLKISATDVDDTGEDPKTSEATVTLTSDPVTQLPIAPQFASTYYTGTIKDGVLTFDDRIEISVGYAEDVELTLSNNEYFSVTNDDKVVTITLKGAIPEDVLATTDHFLFSLFAAKKNTEGGSATIYISIPKDESSKKILKFEKPLYQGTYSKDHQLDLPPAKLTEEFTSAVSFSLIGAFEEYFTVTPAGSTVTITLKKDLTADIMDSNSVLSLVLEARVEGAINGQTIISIQLPDPVDVNKKVLKFEKPVYDAAYLKETSLIIPLVKLTEETEGVGFEILGDNAKLFTVTNSGITVFIDLKESLGDDILNSNSYIAVVLEAKATDAVSGQTVINIALPAKDETIKPTLTFESPYYQASYSVEDQLNTPKIALNIGSPANAQFKLSGDNAAFFTATSDDGISVTIQVKTPLTDDILNKNSYIVIVLEAIALNALNGLTILNIELPDKGTPQTLLNFEKSFYEGKYSDEDTITIPEIKLTEAYSTVTFTLTGDTSKHFRVDGVGSSATITVVEPLTADLLSGNTYIVLVLKAQVKDTVEGQTIINVALPILDSSLEILKFEELYYEASYLVDHTLTTPTIKLTKEYSTAKFTLSGDMKDYFKVSNKGSSLTVVVDKHLPAEILDEKAFIVLVVEAQVEGALNGQAAINIDLPKKDPQIKLKFEENFYTGSYSFSTNYLSLLDITLEEGYSQNIDFTLVGEYSQHFQATSKDNVVTVAVNGAIPESVIEKTSVLVFSLQATRPDAPSATAVIAVKLIRRTGTPGNALTIIEINEGKEYDDLDIGVLEEGCKYVLSSVWPTTPDWFYTDNGILKSRVVKREDPSIANLYLSQTQLEMTINCASQSIQEDLRNEEEEEERFWISTKNINKEENKKLVTIIINDINNQIPVFDTIGPVTVGFPGKEIAYILRPQSLITVHATDADIGINAKIKYTTESDKFAVHPDTGVVYPKSDLYSLLGTETFSFAVVATDEYGAGHSVSLDINVKFLDESQVAVVRVEDGLLENVEEIVSGLSTQTKYSIKLLSSAVLPDSGYETKLGSDRLNEASLVSGMKKDLSGDDTELTLIVYALDSQNNFVTASELSSLISSGNAALPWEVTGETLSESNVLKYNTSTSDNTGLIVGISVLGALLIITLAGIVAYYFLVIRKKYSSFTNSSSGSSMAGSEDSEEDRKSVNVETINERPASQADNLALTLENVINPSFSTKDRLDRFNTDKDVEANNVQPKEDDSSDIDGDEYGASASKDRKRSIRFNEKVLQIDIDTSDFMEDEGL